MKSWLITVAFAALGLFVFLKAVRYASLARKADESEPLDEDGLARAAEDLFMRVQKAWDARDRNALAAMLTPEALEELDEAKSGEDFCASTEILYITTGIVSREAGPSGERASVLFDVVLREEFDPQRTPWDSLLGEPGHAKGSGGLPPFGASGGAAAEGARDADEPVRIREIWHLAYNARSGGWLVDAIQQVR